jgi:hypothetical protein
MGFSLPCVSQVDALVVRRTGQRQSSQRAPNEMLGPQREHSRVELVETAATVNPHRLLTKAPGTNDVARTIRTASSRSV